MEGKIKMVEVNLFDAAFIMSLLAAMLRLSVPIVFTGIGEVIAERAGIVNIGIEGVMLLGAFSATYVAYFTGDAWLGVLVAVIIGILSGYIHGVIAINFKGDQIVSGVGMNMFAYGFTAAWLIIIWGELAAGNSPGVPRIPQIPLPLPGAFSSISPFVFLMVLTAVASYYVLYKTKFGLRLRSIGENPAAADVAGINVYRVQFIATIIGAVLAAVGGAYLAVDWNSMFVRYMTAGRGFIALATVVFSNWNPLLVLVGGLLFGFADGLQMRLAPALGVGFPPQFLQMVPYILTLIVVTGAIGRAKPPAAVGRPYEKE